MPQDKPTGPSPTTYQGSQRVEYTTLQSIRRGDLRLLPRQLSCTHQSAALCSAHLLAAVLPETLPFWTKNSVCSTARRFR